MKDRKQATPGQPVNITKRGKTSASLNPEIQAKIGKQLRAYYAGLIEPPPDRFVELLRKLDKPADEGHSE
jgi:antitoxin (DNA-binding transcriptional repressor) of toxin-antitoxin stability system